MKKYSECTIEWLRELYSRIEKILLNVFLIE